MPLRLLSAKPTPRDPEALAGFAVRHLIPGLYSLLQYRKLLGVGHIALVYWNDMQRLIAFDRMNDKLAGVLGRILEPVDRIGDVILQRSHALQSRSPRCRAW